MKRKKRPLTIIEMMIVITLIGIVAAIVGYNMQGVLEKSKVKQTELTIQKVQDILELEYTLNPALTLEQIAAKPKFYLNKSGLVKDAGKLLVDGWGEKLDIIVENDRLVVSSKKYNDRSN